MEKNLKRAPSFHPKVVQHHHKIAGKTHPAVQHFNLLLQAQRSNCYYLAYIMGAILSCPWFAQASQPASPTEKSPLLSQIEKDPNAALSNELRGQKIHVDMTKSFSHWPMGATHPEYDRLRVETDRVLEKYAHTQSFSHVLVNLHSPPACVSGADKNLVQGYSRHTAVQQVQEV